MAEALANGLPVLANGRAALPETLDDAGWKPGHSEWARQEARRWEPERLGEAYDALFRSLSKTGKAD